MKRLGTVQLECDCCGVRRSGRVNQSVFSLRLALAAVGWHSDDDRNRDRCPTCVDGLQGATTAGVEWMPHRYFAKDRSGTTKPGVTT